MQGVLLSREWQQTADELVISLAAAVVSWVPVSDPQHPQVLDKDLDLKCGNLEKSAVCQPARDGFDFEDSWYFVYLREWYNFSSDPIKTEVPSAVLSSYGLFNDNTGLSRQSYFFPYRI